MRSKLLLLSNAASVRLPCLSLRRCRPLDFLERQNGPSSPSSQLTNLLRSKSRLLTVDDNEDGAASLAELIAASGYSVRIVTRGKEAVQVAAGWLPDVVLCDLVLPDLDGYSVCRSIRALPGASDVHLIAVTGSARDTSRQREDDAGFDRHLLKPIGPQALLENLSRVRIRRNPERLAELRHLMVLDLSAERDFDAIAAAVASSLEVPMAMVSFLDLHRTG